MLNILLISLYILVDFNYIGPELWWLLVVVWSNIILLISSYDILKSFKKF